MDEQLKELHRLYDKIRDYSTGKLIEYDFGALQLTKGECKVIMDALVTRQAVLRLTDDGR